MDLLHTMHSTTIRNGHFRPRKLALPDTGSFHLYGARGTGKTTLVIEHLRDRDPQTWLYIDCMDPVFALEDIDGAWIEAFVREEAIETLVLDHYYEGFLDVLPRVEQLIVISRAAMPQLGLPEYGLSGLDFEEVLSFGRDVSVEHRFNLFVRSGTLPAAVLAEPGMLERTLRGMFLASFDEDESRVMLILARASGHRVSTHRLYQSARESFRISKDYVYRTVKRFEEEQLIYFIEDITQKGARKMILYDPALSRYLCKQQTFAVTFDSLVALSLIKHRFDFAALGYRGYVCDETLILPAPFETEEQAWAYIYNHIRLYRRHAIRHAWIVTVSNRYRFTLGEITFEALPFFEWSILSEG